MHYVARLKAAPQGLIDRSLLHRNAYAPREPRALDRVRANYRATVRVSRATGGNGGMNGNGDRTTGDPKADVPNRPFDNATAVTIAFQ